MKNKVIRASNAILLTSLWFVLVVAVGLATGVIVIKSDDNVRQLPPCEFEDSTDCYWDARVRGNGIGTSFVNVDGVTYLLGVAR